MSDETPPPGDRGARRRLRELLRAPRLPVDLEALPWIDLAPGVRLHVLESLPSGFPKRLLVWGDSGAEVPEHPHDVPEDTLVLEGTVEVIGAGAGVYAAGEILHSNPGETHTVRNAGDGRCLCYVICWRR